MPPPKPAMTYCASSSSTLKQVLVLGDWDNIFICLFEKFKNEMRLGHRISATMEWIQNRVGQIFGGYGFMFAPEHLSVIHQQLCINSGFRLFTCPKREVRDKSGNIGTEDTVDETIIWFGEIMLKHPDTGFICLISGDDDYVPLLEDAGKLGVKRALVAPTLASLSRSKTLIRLVDKHPITGRRMILRMDNV